MSNYNYNQATCPPLSEEPLPAVACRPPPPPPGYPVRDGGREVGGDVSAAAKTRSRGDGFWRGCCAAMCCCCLVDACF